MNTQMGDYLALANEVFQSAGRLVEMANTALGSPEAVPLTTRDRVLIGLALKVEGCLRAVVVDARDGRAEAMHHLKTMTEAFMYYHAVAADLTEATATLVLAKIYNDKAVFYQESATFRPDNAGEAVRWKAARDGLLGGKTYKDAIQPLAKIERLARNHSRDLHSWYALAYRLACEPAHIGDLQEIMPAVGATQIEMMNPTTAGNRVIIAIDLALHLCVGLLKTINDTNELGLRVETASFEERLAAIRAPALL